MSSTPVQPGQITGLGRLFSYVAFIEAATWTGLLVGMFLKYVTKTTEVGVQIFGMLHGIAFIGYVLISVAAARSLGWSRRITLIVLAAAVPPLTTIPLERWMRRTGRLSAATPEKSPRLEYVRAVEKNEIQPRDIATPVDG